MPPGIRRGERKGPLARPVRHRMGEHMSVERSISNSLLEAPTEELCAPTAHSTVVWCGRLTISGARLWTYWAWRFGGGRVFAVGGAKGVPWSGLPSSDFFAAAVDAF